MKHILIVLSFALSTFLLHAENETTALQYEAQLSSPSDDILYKKREYELNEPDFQMFNIQVGAWIPLGNFRNVLGPSPYIGLRVSIPTSRQYSPWSIGVGADIIFPSGARNFDYTPNKHVGVLSAKTDLIVDLGVWLRHESRLSRDVYWSKYAGIGLNMLVTDQTYFEYEEKYDEEYDEYYEEEVEKHYMLDSFLLNAGTEIRHKNLGVFIEFNYMPRSSSRVNSNFGDKTITGGLSIRF